jgi:transposase-like protein
MASTPKAPSASELKRQLGVTYKTAWTMRRKIVYALSRRDGELMLRGLVEMDESFIGGREQGTKGRQTERKTLVAIAVDHTAKGGCRHAHLQVVPDAGSVSLTTAAQQNIASSSTVITDGWPAYNALADQGYHHWPWVLETPEDASRVLPWAHIVVSNFKRWILNSFHSVSAKHLQAYLDEFCYRLNRRWQRSDLFRRILNRCLRFTPQVTYAQLVAS